MNHVPVRFYAQVCASYELNTISSGMKLSTVAGDAFTQSFKKSVFYEVDIRNGRIENGCLKSYHHKEYEILNQFGSIVKTFFRFVQIHVDVNSEEEYSSDLEALNQLLEFVRNQIVVLFIHTSNLSKEVYEFIAAIPCISVVIIDTAVTTQIEQVLETVIHKKTLNVLEFVREHKFNDVTTRLLVNALKQDQFDSASPSANCDFPLGSVVAEWKQNSAQMVGKEIWSWDNVLHNQMIEELGFRKSTAEDDRYLEMFPPKAKSVWSEPQEVFVLKDKKGCAIFVLVHELRPSKSLIVFA